MSSSLEAAINPLNREWVTQVMADGRLPSAVLSFFKEHEDTIAELSKDAFTEFVSLLDRNQNEEAIEKLVQSSSFSALAQMMGDIAVAQKQANEKRARIKKMALAFVAGVGGTAVKVLLTILTGGV